MRKLFLSLVLAFLGVGSGPAFAADPCEARLTTSIAIVTQRNLANGKLKLEWVRAMVDSPTPLNPVRFQVPLPDIAALARFYEAALPRVSDWEKVREELREVLALRSESAAIEAKAAEDTRTVWAPIVSREHEGLVDQGRIFRSRSGRTYFAARYGDKLSVFDSQIEAPIWSGQSGQQVGFRERGDGRVSLEVWIEQAQTDDERARRVRRRKVVSVDLTTGAPVEKTIEIPGSLQLVARTEETRARVLARGGLKTVVPFIEKWTRNVPDDSDSERGLFLYRSDEEAGLQPVNLRPLALIKGDRTRDPELQILELSDGRFVSAGGRGTGSPGDGFITYFSPFAREPHPPRFFKFGGWVSHLRLAEAAPGRVLLFAFGRQGMNQLRVAVYEPDVSDEPILLVPIKELGTASAGAFVHDGNLVVAVVDPNELGSSCALFAPEKSKNEFAHFQLRAKVLRGILQTPDQVTFAMEAAPFQTEFYSLLQRWQQ